MHRRNLDARIPAPDGPRALLKAQLAQLAEPPRTHWRLWWAAAAACALALAVYPIFLHSMGRPAGRVVAVMVPNPSLTPGATVLVDQSEVCMESLTKNKTVPVALQRRVFDEYGIRAATPAAYEVDYLITPALGGADDIHNLWPQAYTATVWNAQVKDTLEDHLREARNLLASGDAAQVQRLAGSLMENHWEMLESEARRLPLLVGEKVAAR